MTQRPRPAHRWPLAAPAVYLVGFLALLVIWVRWNAEHDEPDCSAGERQRNDPSGTSRLWMADYDCGTAGRYALLRHRSGRASAVQLYVLW